jgi:hypothetical protein
MGTACLSPNSLRAFSEDYIAGESLRLDFTPNPQALIFEIVVTFHRKHVL